ncbi:Hpt domain-containing protein [Thiothrix nivea]|uniref:Hpt domain protein n=1 Tax=Thiothrix nivea (strain ATCC 35100 / DSM 5205 / JP2) TaxID=870187 RepID=A0A656HEN6_THINJ|nr:Hpt domain-containing protein [Thiothrix nivea]EIJ33926.1 Hpt domain protein [Thiothrix nivea DSM 5205]
MTIMPSSPIDEETYSQLLDIMADEFAELVNCFRDDSDQALRLLQQHVNAEDSAAVGIICHKLKSSSKLIGAFKMAEFARLLEDYKDDNDQQLAETHVQQLCDEYARVQEWLDAHVVAC